MVSPARHLFVDTRRYSRLPLHAGRRLQRGHRCIAASLAAVAALLAGGLIDPQPRLVWNVSDSAPRGLYWVSRPSRPGIGEFAAARLSPDVEQLAAQRHYLPQGIPLIKKVAAVQGDEICASGERVAVFGTLVATRREVDPAGFSLPWWNGCRRLGAGELLLINSANPLSFDGRYFGPTDSSRVIGRASLLWRL